MFRYLLISLVLSFSLSSLSYASQTFNDGMTAYDSKKYEEAITFFKSAAEQGDASAQYSLGVMYVNGQGVTKDYEQAVAWYRKAAEQGHSSAQSNLGVMYDNGQGVTKDDKQALAWYRKAAEQGDASAQFNLGVMYKNGQGVTKDDKQAVAWYRKAAEQGHASAQYNLGIMYKNGQGVTKDYEQAVAWYRKASEQGVANAQSNLGDMYENGRGVTKDYDQALALYKKAGTKFAKRKYSALSGKVNCSIGAKTKLFNVVIKCSGRDELMVAVKAAGAGVKHEDKQSWGDKYHSSSILKGSSVLAIDYTVDNYFAKATYTFPSNLNTAQVTQVRDFVANKYGSANSSNGRASLGAVSYKWVLEDGIEISVSRGWPDTTTFLSFIHPSNNQVMIDERTRQKKSREAKAYESQNNAF